MIGVLGFFSLISSLPRCSPQRSLPLPLWSLGHLAGRVLTLKIRNTSTEREKKKKIKTCVNFLPAPPFCPWISDLQTAFTVTVFPIWPGFSAEVLCLERTWLNWCCVTAGPDVVTVGRVGWWRGISSSGDEAKKRHHFITRVINQLTNRGALTELCSVVKHAGSG